MHLTFRPLAVADFQQFADWLAKPHVQAWWREPATVEHVSKDYGDCTRGDMRTRVYVVHDGDRLIGIIQAFWIRDYPEEEQYYPIRNAVSIDYLIGEEDYVGRGVGAQMITQFVEGVVRPLFPGASGVATAAETANPASLGALRKAGFKEGGIITGEYGTPERVMILEF